jgi:prepilin-type N-terminal cleavage/methylation domain-containing protein
MITNYKKEKGFTPTPTLSKTSTASRRELVRGFTLIETLVAISILMIAIASPINLAQKALSSAVSSRDQMTASFLAQDGLEAIKNLRDEIAIRPDSLDWLSPAFDKCLCDNNTKQCDLDLPLANYCNIDTTLNDLNSENSIVGSDNPALANPLKVGVDNNGVFTKYDLSSVSSSKYSRYINIMKTPGNPDEAVVQVRVSWPSGSGMQKVDIKDFIYNYSPFL